MSSALPFRPRLPVPEPAYPSLEEGAPTTEERRRAATVGAAHWRARELAAGIFGSVAASEILGRTRSRDAAGLLRLDVPFEDLGAHRRREAIFLASAAADPLLSTVPFVYVIGPRSG